MNFEIMTYVFYLETGKKGSKSKYLAKNVIQNRTAIFGHWLQK